ncbi:hypothetical protein [Nocardia sp. CS682]|uniref:hypothetical protein n=1 Tax=Nocardia sp. CS682 TaxID=1047172 RepID=UPI0010751D5A|nr:hypothetical protein [Nocardia sp. CS682]QBS43625.1 hypothetical protein DMB37_29495 [Nocardia sp. CS682]
MVTIRNSARIATAIGATALAIASATAVAAAENAIEVSGVGPVNIGVDYSCEASAGVAAIRAMVGDPQADSPSATGTQTAVTCDGSRQTAVVLLTGANGADAPLSAGQTVQVRVALVDSSDTVVTGQAKVVSLA